MTKLLALRVENYKAITLVEVNFDPAGGVTNIVGKNEAGKTSLFDAFETIVSGRKAPKQVRPVHGDAESARIVATFDDLVVTRVIRPGKADQIRTTNPDGTIVYKNNEAMIDGLYSHIGINPFAFSLLNEADQVRTLLQLIGVDPAKLDTEYAERFAQRTVEKRTAKELTAQLDGMPLPTGPTPDARVVVADLMGRLDKVNEHNAEVAEVARKAQAASADYDRYAQMLTQDIADAEAAQKRVETARQTVAEKEADLQLARLAEEEIGATVSTDEIRAKIADADATNRAIDNAAARTAHAAKVKAAADVVKASDDRLAAILAEKKTMLTSTPMPVPGLAIDPESNMLLLKGQPFSQASTGVKVRTGIAIEMALNPKLQAIFVRDAANLDAGNRAVIHELALANEYTVILEIAGSGVEDSAGTTVILTEGFVSEVRAA